MLGPQQTPALLACLPRPQPLILHPASSACTSLYRVAMGSLQTQRPISPAFSPILARVLTPHPSQCTGTPALGDPSVTQAPTSSSSPSNRLPLSWLPRPLLTSITYPQPPLCCSPTLDPNATLHLGLILSPPQPALHPTFLFSPKSLPGLAWFPAPGEPQPLGPAPGTLEGVRACST